MKIDRHQKLEGILESAVVENWADLMHGAQSGLINIEYGLAPNGTLDYLRIWSSITRGYWLLVCAYWMSASGFHDVGVHFENGYASKGLARILPIVMQHQSAFELPTNLWSQGLLQITTPTEQERTAAAASMSDAFDRVSSAFAEPLLAAG